MASFITLAKPVFAQATIIAANAWIGIKQDLESNPELVRKVKVIAATALAVGVACYIYPEAALCAVGTAHAFKHAFPKSFHVFHENAKTLANAAYNSIVKQAQPSSTPAQTTTAASASIIR